MSFSNFNERLQRHIQENFDNYKDCLFETSTDKDSLWNLYLNSFPAGTNEIYRKRREYDCSCCRHFIRSFGHIVWLKDQKLHTIWDFNAGSPVFQPIVDTLSAYVKAQSIKDIFLPQEEFFGTRKSFEKTEKGIQSWDHFFVGIPKKYVLNKNKSVNITSKIAEYRDTRNVFFRSLNEISRESIEIVLELISSNSLYKGEEWKENLLILLRHKRTFDNLSPNQRYLYVWEKTKDVGIIVGRIKNHSIGVLLQDLTKGVFLEDAVKAYERIVAPTNYKRPKAIFTQRMLEDAKKTIMDLGYYDSLERRFATLDDISVENILFSNKDQGKIPAIADIFGEIQKDVKVKPQKFDRVEEISVEKFVKDVLPAAREVEVFLENSHISNMMSLTAPKDKTAPSMFKWDNAFGWTYKGNITDSDIKERVKSEGGDVNGVLRFSISWNDRGEHDRNDLDARCITPSGQPIYFGRLFDSKTRGTLDVDIRIPIMGKSAVENITFPSIDDLAKGTYIFEVNQYDNRGGRKGFRAEIEFNGEIFSFDYNKNLLQGSTVKVAAVTYEGNGNFSIRPFIEIGDNSFSSQDIWGIKTGTFVPVSLITESPNYWNKERGVGHRHYFFILKGCENKEKPNGFYNEFLKEDLLVHKRVFEGLGNRLQIQDSENQLSGVGFSATKSNHVVVKVRGQIERILKINI